MLIYTEEEEYDNSAFVSAEIKAGRIVAYYYIVYLAHKIWFSGDAVLIHGHVVHKSEQSMKHRIGSILYHVSLLIDKSPVSRQIYGIHIMEMHNSIYCKENW